jgi:N-acetylglucosamine-6-phosphate deacetylase
MKKIFTNGTLLTPFETILEGAVVVGENGLIEYAGPELGVGSILGNRIDAKGQYVIPGFINTHTHGGNGIDFGIGNLEEDLEEYSKWAPRNGVTGFIMTLTGPDVDSISHTIHSYAEILDNRSEWPGAIPLGLHLEGPFLNPEKHGAYNQEWIRDPSMEEVNQYIDAGKGWVKHISMAPELENADAVAEYLVNEGVVVSLAHSNTDYQTAADALNGNFTHVTHTFNCQSTMHHRAPGVVGAVLASDNVTAELTGDPHHVYPPAMKILYRCIGPERIVLVTDAISGTGLPDGKYSLMEQEVTIKAGVARYADGSLGGSVSTMDSCVRVLANQVGAPLDEAVRMASFNPAKVIGEEKRIGSIEVGKQANLAIMNHQLEIEKTFVCGQSVYSKYDKNNNSQD